MGGTSMPVGLRLYRGMVKLSTPGATVGEERRLIFKTRSRTPSELIVEKGVIP